MAEVIISAGAPLPCHSPSILRKNLQQGDLARLRGIAATDLRGDQPVRPGHRETVQFVIFLHCGAELYRKAPLARSLKMLLCNSVKLDELIPTSLCPVLRQGRKKDLNSVQYRVQALFVVSFYSPRVWGAKPFIAFRLICRCWQVHILRTWDRAPGRYLCQSAPSGDRNHCSPQEGEFCAADPLPFWDP